MKILITGGNGFIGKNLALSLVNFHEVISVSKSNANPYSDKIKFVTGDFSNSNLLDKILPGVNIVIHLAYSTVPENSVKDPSADVEANVLGTLRLLERMKYHQIKRIIFLSSGGVVYGNAEKLPITEDSPLKPVSSYGITKMMIENNMVILAEKWGIDYCILRVANAYGEGQHGKKNQGVINIWLNKIINGEPVELISDTKYVRDYVNVLDVVEAMRLVVENQYVGIYNIGTGIGTDLYQLLSMIENLLNKKANIQSISGRGFDVNQNILSYEKFETVSGWKPEISLEQGLKKIIG